MVGLVDVLEGLDRYEEISRRVELGSEIYSTCPLQCVWIRDRDICDRTFILHPCPWFALD